MAESLVAVGLAGNIVQFISFASNLVSKTKEIHQSASGVACELDDLESISIHLKVLTRPLLNKGDVSAQLRKVAERSSEVADELLKATAEIQYHGKSSKTGPTKWQSFRKALKCIWKKEQIDALKMRLELLRDEVSLHLISDAW